MSFKFVAGLVDVDYSDAFDRVSDFLLLSLVRLLPGANFWLLLGRNNAPCAYHA